MILRKKKSEKMADMHCHILPGVDDGARSLEETIKMLEIAEDEGITDIIATPHYKEGRHNASIRTIMERIVQAQEEAEKNGISVCLYPGMEVFYFDGLEDALERGSLLTLNGTDRILVEFSPLESFSYIRNAMDRITGTGFVPVIAHAERYECILKNWRCVEELKNFDVEVQVNASSITGALGRQTKKFVHNLLRGQMVDYIGTDAHDWKKRIPAMEKCLAELYRKYNASYINAITYENAMAIIEAQ